MVEVIVYFGGVLYNGENAVRNSVTNTREEFPDSFRRQAEPISEHHKLTPVWRDLKLEGGFMKQNFQTSL